MSLSCDLIVLGNVVWEEEENAQRALNGVRKQPLAVKQEEVEGKEGETNNQ